VYGWGVKFLRKGKNITEKIIHVLIFRIKIYKTPPSFFRLFFQLFYGICYSTKRHDRNQAPPHIESDEKADNLFRGGGSNRSAFVPRFQGGNRKHRRDAIDDSGGNTRFFLCDLQ